MPGTGLIVEVLDGAISVNAYNNPERSNTTHVFADLNEAIDHATEVIMAVQAVRSQAQQAERALIQAARDKVDFTRAADAPDTRDALGPPDGTFHP